MAFARLIAPVVRLLFRPTISGLENLPDSGPYLLVSNHNAGLGMAEIFSFAVVWLQTFQDTRPLAGFAHPVGFRVWPITVAHRQFGVIPSTYDAAYAALADNIPILVFPGGDHETLRPVWQANRVDFGGRKGFLRIAQQSQTPVVPMGICGSHYTAPMLFRARWMAWFFLQPKLLGINRWGISLLGLLGTIAIVFLPVFWPWKLGLTWIWLGSPIQYLPWIPWTISFRIGPVIAPGLTPDDASLSRVERTIEGLLRAD